jgi:hypothetical protein
MWGTSSYGCRHRRRARTTPAQLVLFEIANLLVCSKYWPVCTRRDCRLDSEDVTCDRPCGADMLVLQGPSVAAAQEASTAASSDMATVPDAEQLD